MKTKTMAMIGMLSWCLHVPAAHSADATFNVNGKTITCTVTGITTSGGVWGVMSLFINYEFCNGNRVTYFCYKDDESYRRIPPDELSRCSTYIGPVQQDCNKTRYTFRDYNEKDASLLYNGTSEARKYVCETLFRQMTVTAEPLK